MKRVCFRWKYVLILIIFCLSITSIALVKAYEVQWLWPGCDWMTYCSPAEKVASCDINTNMSSAPACARPLFDCQSKNITLQFRELTMPAEIWGINLTVIAYCNASFSKQDVRAEMSPGRNFTVAITMNNMGEAKWDVANFKLGLLTEDVWRVNRVKLTGDIAPFGSSTFTFNITTPSTEGEHDFSWRMLAPNGTFNGIDDNVSLNYGANPIPKNTFTMEAWVKAIQTHEIDSQLQSGTAGVSGQKYVFWPDYKTLNDAGAGISVGNNGVSVYEHSIDYLPALAVYSSAIGIGWNHIAVTYTEKKPKVYVNGVSVTPNPLTSQRANVHAPTQIGGGLYGYFNGMIDGARIWNRALSADEILQHSKGNIPSVEGLVSAKDLSMWFGEPSPNVRIAVKEDKIAPWFKNNQGNAYANATTNLSKITFDVDFFDNIDLMSFNVSICNKTGCMREMNSIGGVNFTANWGLPKKIWDWISAQGEADFTVNITVSDSAIRGPIVGNVNMSIRPFYIFRDLTLPTDIVVSSPGGHFAGMPTTVRAEAKDAFSGIGKITIYIDGQAQKSCNSTPCEVSIAYDAGQHSYYAIVEDKARNSDKSETKTFTISSETDTQTCDEIKGYICKEDEFCPLSFIKTKDTAKCCPRQCTTEMILASCKDQGGNVYDPSVLKCTGSSVPASDTLAPSECCVGSISVPEGTALTAYWTDDSGNKVAVMGMGESAKCLAVMSGSEGKKASFDIYEGNEVKQKFPDQDFKNNIAEISYTVSDIGTYRCEVNVATIEPKSAELKVVEAPSKPLQARLPGFGFLQMIAALSLILIYYCLKRR